MQIAYCFYIKVEIDGRKTPILKVEKPNEPLSILSFGTMNKYNNVNIALDQLNEIVAGRKELIAFTDTLICIVDVRKTHSVVTSSFDEFQPFMVLTSELVRLLEEWRDFLWHYENGKIPGLIPG